MQLCSSAAVRVACAQDLCKGPFCVRILQSVSSHGSRAGVRVTQSVREAMLPQFMPMVVPARPWTHYDRGGHLLSDQEVVRLHGNSRQRAALKEADGAPYRQRRIVQARLEPACSSAQVSFAWPAMACRPSTCCRARPRAPHHPGAPPPRPARKAAPAPPCPQSGATRATGRLLFFLVLLASWC